LGADATTGSDGGDAGGGAPAEGGDSEPAGHALTAVPVCVATSVHSHTLGVLPSKAAPVASPLVTAAERTISPFRVSIPEPVPQIGQELPGSVAEKSPI
jgi:hypothetical protein